ncbi:MAG: flagellar biosynthetic protein FliR [Planctomycetes bacterium]|nr:flagellar biosynthetic protein FliR [Planctomycetota bacterium]
MLDLVQINILAYLLILFRISGIMLIAPFLGSRNIPAQVQIGLSMILAFIVAPVVDKSALVMPGSLGLVAMAVLSELSIGLLIGFAATMLFSAVQLAGHFVDQEMGIGMANVIDPVSTEQVTIMGQFEFFLGLIVFILLNGHYLIIATVVHSFKDIPLMGFVFTDKLALQISDTMFVQMLILSVKLSAPIVVALLITTIAMGFLARTVPEMNIFIMGFALRLIVGFAIMIMVLDPIFRYIFPSMISQWFKAVDGLIVLMK